MAAHRQEAANLAMEWADEEEQQLAQERADKMRGAADDARERAERAEEAADKAEERAEEPLADLCRIARHPRAT